MSLSSIAKQATNRTESIMTGKEKVEVSSIINVYPDGIHITSASIIKGKDGDYAVINFAEDEKSFFFAGKVLTDIVKQWLEVTGTEEAMNKELTAEPVAVRLYDAKNKSGRTYTGVEVL